jgi:hypothetical protein
VKNKKAWQRGALTSFELKNASPPRSANFVITKVGNPTQHTHTPWRR